MGCAGLKARFRRDRDGLPLRHYLPLPGRPLLDF